MLVFVCKHRMVSPNLGFRKQLLIFENESIKADYNLDKIDFKSIVWPPKEGITYEPSMF